MTDLPQGGSLDLLALAADEEIVAALASGRAVADDDLTVLLTRFRDELDDAYDESDLAVAPVPVPPVARARRWRRGAALGVATFTVAASLTGVAAAVGGDANPLHRAIADLVDPGPDRSLQEARRLLHDAEHATAGARARGWIAAAERTRVLASLDRVGALSATAHRGDALSIERRVAAVRAVLATLPATPPPAPSDEGPGSSDDRGPAVDDSRADGGREQETRGSDDSATETAEHDSESRSGSDSESTESGSDSGAESGSTSGSSGSGELTTPDGSGDGASSGEVSGSDSGSDSGSSDGLGTLVGSDDGSHSD